MREKLMLLFKGKRKFITIPAIPFATIRVAATVLRDNMESQIYYRPSDLTTAKYLEERLGTRSGFARSKTLHHSHNQ